MVRSLPFACLLGLLAAPAGAQQRDTLDAFQFSFGATPDLSFPAAPSPFKRQKGTFLFKPEGAAPFPAIVLMPTCGGHNGSLHVFDWAEKALKRGYAALVVDPLTPRGVERHNCVSPPKVLPARLLKDAFDAAAHLRAQPFVDGERVALMGFSQGAMAALGATGADRSGRDGRRPFGAAVSFYPACAFYDLKVPGRDAPVNYRYLPKKVATPLLVLMGEEDTETDPKDCVPLLSEQKGEGAPLEWEVYKNTTHAFDQAEYATRPFRKKDARGTDVEYRYNESSVRAAEARAFAFIERQLGKR